MILRDLRKESGSASSLSFRDISARIGSGWPAVHERMGIPSHFLRDRHGPCPCCGGKDRFRYDNKDQRGTFYCSGCGAGDGFTLLMRFHHWDHSRVRTELIGATGMARNVTPLRRALVSRHVGSPVLVAEPSRRVLRLCDELQPLRDIPDVVEYLTSRSIWPHAARTSLRAHAGIDYFDEHHQIVGRYPSLVAAVRDLDGKLVTAHVTYIDAGRKLKPHEPRKFMSGMSGRDGCAVRLQPLLGDELGISEGIETAISAHALHGIPTWATLSTAMMRKFTPPPAVKRLVICADLDEAGMEAAAVLTDRLQDRLHIELRTPPVGFIDWNDILTARGRS